MTRLSDRTAISKVLVLILSIAFMLLMFYIGMPLVKPTLNTLHCQNAGRIVVWSIRKDNPVSSGHVEVICADGSGAVYQPLLSVIKDAQDAVYSPDGNRVALIPSSLQDDLMPYTSQDNRDHIWIMNSDGSGLVRLSNIHRHESYPAWSPDNQRLAFSPSMITDEPDGGIYVTDLMCVDTGQDCASTTTLLVSDGFCPAWSPNSKSIAFVAGDLSGNNNFNWEIFVVNVDGSNRVNLTRNPADDFCPVWSPNGQSIVFYSLREPSGIYMMNADSSNPTFITDGDRPKWSPNGEFIAFISARDNGGRVIPLFPDSSAPAEALYLMARDGSKIIKLTHHDYEAITEYFWLP